MKLHKNLVLGLSLILAFVLGWSIVNAFTEPTAAFPGGAPAAPLDTGNLPQSKDGVLFVKFLGVNTQVLGYTLDVVGTLGVTGRGEFGSGLFNNNVDVLGYVSSTQICLGGSCRSSWAGSTSNGQANYLPVWNPAILFVTSTIYQDPNTHNIGIGTASPSAKLEVAGNIKSQGDLTIISYVGGSSSNGLILGTGKIDTYGGFQGCSLYTSADCGTDTANGDTNNPFTCPAGDNRSGLIDVTRGGDSVPPGGGTPVATWYKQTVNCVSPDEPLYKIKNNAGILEFSTADGVVRFSLNQAGALSVPGTLGVIGGTTLSGNVGIGTASPTQKLTIAGNINKSGSWVVSDANWGANTFEVHNSSWDGSSNDNYGGITGGHGYYYGGLQSGGSSGNEAGSGQLYVAGNSMLMGNVGIGTASPSAKLEVAGATTLSGALGVTGATTLATLAANSGSFLNGLAWRNGTSQLGTDQGGSIELGGMNAVANPVTGGMPYLDFHYGTGSAQDYNTRIINNADNQLTITGQVPITLNIDGKGVSSGGWEVSSDIRLKTNVAELTNVLPKLLGLNGVSFDWRVSEFPQKNLPQGHQLGLIAQQIEQMFPELVSTNADGYKAVDYGRFTAVLLEAIKEQQAQISALQNQLLQIQNK